MKKLLLLFFPLLIVSCALQGPALWNRKISIGTWNTQTFFDSNNDGTEYSEFRKGESWTLEKYEERLDRLCQVINEMDCDVIVLEELENEGVIYDINNRLAGNAWNPKKCWNYSCFAKNKGDAIGCGVLSKYELLNFRVHNLDIKVEEEKQPSMRPVMEVTVSTGKEEFVLFVNHWKSKSGGEEATEVWRNHQERLLSYLADEVTEEGKAFVACGDFNRDIKEFKTGYFGSNKTAVKSVWIDEEGKLKDGPGSYFYKDSWERIDHIFLSKSFEIKDFKVLAKTPWCYEDGVPKEYKLYSGDGYSDHVPLMVEVEMREL